LQFFGGGVVCTLYCPLLSRSILIGGSFRLIDASDGAADSSINRGTETQITRDSATNIP
jgi:hypothetical protein